MTVEEEALNLASQWVEHVRDGLGYEDFVAALVAFAQRQREGAAICKCGHARSIHLNEQPGRQTETSTGTECAYGFEDASLCDCNRFVGECCLTTARRCQPLFSAALKMYRQGHVVGCEYFSSEVCTCGKLELGIELAAIRTEFGLTENRP